MSIPALCGRPGANPSRATAAYHAPVDTASLLWGTVFGAIGAGYILYGRRQREAIPLLCGIGLVGFTWFVTNPWAIVLAGAALMAAPFVARRYV